MTIAIFDDYVPRHAKPGKHLAYEAVPLEDVVTFEVWCVNDATHESTRLASALREEEVYLVADHANEKVDDYPASVTFYPVRAVTTHELLAPVTVHDYEPTHRREDEPTAPRHLQVVPATATEPQPAPAEPAGAPESTPAPPRLPKRRRTALGSLFGLRAPKGS